MKKIANIKEQGSILFDQGIVSGVNFLNGILLARYLGIESFGVYAFLWIIILLFSAIQQSLFVAPFVYFTHQKNNRSYNSLFIYSQIIFAMCCLIVSVIGLSIYYYINSDTAINVNQILSSAILISSFLIFDFIRKYLIALRKLKAVLLMDSTVYSIQIVTIFILYFWKIPFSLYSIYWLLSFTFIFGYVIGLFSSNVVKINIKDYRDDLLEVWTYAKWLVSSAFLTFTSTNIFFMFCGLYLGSASLGAVRVTQNLMGVFSVLGQFIENYLPVKLAQLFSNNQIHEVNKSLIKTTSIVVILLLIFLFFSIIFSSDLYNFIYGNEYIKYSYLLNWFIVTYIFFFINNAVRYGLRTVGSTKPIFYSYVINTVISLISVYPLLKYFELSGLIFGILLTQSTSIFYLVKGYMKELDIISINLIKQN